MLDFKGSISKSFSVCDICPVSILVLKSTVGFLPLWIFAFVFFANVLPSMCSSYIKIEAHALCQSEHLFCWLFILFLICRFAASFCNVAFTVQGSITDHFSIYIFFLISVSLRVFVFHLAPGFPPFTSVCCSFLFIGSS